jgi:DNA recombination protein RmuC
MRAEHDMSVFLMLLVTGLCACLLGVALAIYFARRTNSPIVAGPHDNELALARLQEREKFLVEQLDKLKSQMQEYEGLSGQQASSLVDLKEKLAAADEKLIGLEREIARERELASSLEIRLQNETAEERVVKDVLQGELTELSKKLAAAERSEAELRGQIKRAVDHISERDVLIAELRGGLDDVRSTVATRDSTLAAAGEREASLIRTIAEREEQLKGLQDQLKAEFENIANKVLTTATGQLTEKSQESLTAILDPLRTRITEFQLKVEAAHLEDTRQRSVLGEQIRQAAQANQSIGQQAENLTKALKGDSQLRGRWGEHKLELILEKSGLIKGRDFVVQGGGLNIRTEEGASQRPDVIVFLPENRHLVIDSKVSLIDYLEYEAADSDETRGECLRNLVSSVRGHVDGLAGKNYQRAETINSLEFVLMFVPMDSVFVLVTQNDQALREYAWQRGIIIVPPSTLFVTMETVASVWRLQRQSENAREIADKAGQLYDKLAAIVGDLNEVHEKIQAAARAHGEAMKKLAKGRGNALLRAQQLKSLGVSSKKEFPPVFIGTERHAVSDDDDDGELPQVSAITPKLLERPEGA